LPSRPASRLKIVLLAAALASAPLAARADDIKIALLRGLTGPLQAYAKQTETGFMMGLEYATKGTMEVNGKKIVVVTKDDQGKPDLAKSALAEAYEDDGADIAVGTTSSPATIAMLPVAEAHDVSVARVALAWLLAKKAVTSVIVGAKTIEQLDDNLAATELALTEHDLEALDRASALRPEYPAWMLERMGGDRTPAPRRS